MNTSMTPADKAFLSKLSAASGINDAGWNPLERDSDCMQLRLRAGLELTAASIAAELKRIGGEPKAAVRRAVCEVSLQKLEEVKRELCAEAA